MDSFPTIHASNAGQPPYRPRTNDEIEIYNLYMELLKAWNDRHAAHYAALFMDTGLVIGFDGSEMKGPREIEETLTAIFNQHRTNRYVSKVREILFLTTEVAMLHAGSGMFSPHEGKIIEAANAVQVMIAVKRNDTWRIALFQNTPAQWHGRPERVASFTRELQALL